jgi:hypothetical protein
MKNDVRIMSQCWIEWAIQDRWIDESDRLQAHIVHWWIMDEIDEHEHDDRFVKVEGIDN